VRVGDTLLKGGCNEVLWTANSDGYPAITDHDANYCNAKVYPHADTAIVTLAYNEFTNFCFYQGYQFYSSDSAIVTTRSYNGQQITTGVNNVVSSNGNISVSPNPAHDMVLVNNSEPIKSVSVFDAAGRLAGSYDGLAQNRLEIPLQQLQAGLYFLQVNTAGGTSRQLKVVKQ